MTSSRRVLSIPLLAATLAGLAAAASPTALVYDVRAFGAKGDGRTVDTAAINAAIEAAAAAGGGTVVLPAGTYPSFSIHLKSHVALQLGPGAVLLAAEPSPERGRYDLPEPNEHDLYQDFGHSHWQNSLIWGIGLEDVAILGPGRIDGAGLTRRGPGARWSRKAGDRPLSMGAAVGASGDPEAAALRAMDGQGNKAIALKLCRNVRLAGFSVLNGGHFAVLATGVDNLTIDDLAIDTNRDGIDVDACRNVRVSNTSVNSPNDDAIVLKSSYALGVARPTENVTITNCQVSGYDLGTYLAGSFGRTQERAPDRDGPTGRIKLGTESSGGFRNITVSNCSFDRSRGLALETVDGGDIEDVTVTNLTMRDVTTAPLFLRVGNRGRTPGDPPPGRMRRIVISNVVASGVDPRYPALIAGLAGHPVEDVDLANVRILYRGGGTREDAAREPPENETAYPEPSMFGTLPAYGFYLRHARNVTLRDVEVGFEGEDLRPAFALHDVADVLFDHVRGLLAPGVPFVLLRDVRGLSAHDSPGFPETRPGRVALAAVPAAPGQAPAPASAAAPPVTDSNTPLHLLKPDYPVPYGPVTPEKITEVLQRVRGYLEAQTPARIVDRATGQALADLTKPGAELVIEPGAFRVTSYEWGVVYSGMLLAAQTTGDPAFQDYVARRLALVATLADHYRAHPVPNGPLRSVLEPRALDDAGSLCAAMIKASRAGVAVDLRPMIDNFIGFISTKEFRLPDGTLARNRPQPSTLWLDDLYMSVPALAQMGKLTGERRYYDDAVKQVLQFSRRLFNREQGLFMHGWVQGMEVHPEFRWARANGWAVMTLVELLDALPEDHPDRAAVVELLRAHVRGLAARQSGSGFWHQLLDREDSYLETSATAIYAYAMARAIDRGWIDAVAYGPAAVLAWNAVTTKVNAQGQVEGTCVGTGMGFDPAFYYHRPTSPFAAHGYGPVLLAGAEMIRLVKTYRFETNDSSTQLYK